MQPISSASESENFTTTEKMPESATEEPEHQQHHDDKETMIESDLNDNANHFREQYTVDDAVEHCGFGRFQIFLFCMGLACWMCDAIEIMLIGYVLPTLQKEWNLSGVQKACTASILFVGMFAGALIFGSFADRFGRRRALILNLIYTIIPAVLSAFSTSWVMFTVIRAFTGLGVSGIQIIYGLVSEFLPVKRRALVLLSMTTMATMIATLLITGLSWILLPNLTTTVGSMQVKSWRILLLLLAIPLLIATILSPLVPESPRYDILNGNRKRAIQTIYTMAQWNRVPILDGDLVLEKTEDSETASDLQVANSQRRYLIKKLYLLFSPKYWRITCVMSFIWFVSSFTFFGIQLLAAEYLIGDGKQKYVRVFIPALADIPVLLIHILLINRIGRKITMYITYGLGGVSLLIMLIPAPAPFLRVVVVIARIFIQAAFASANLATPEYFPTEIRATGLGFTSSISRVAGIVTPFVSSAVFEASKPATLCVYAVACIGAVFGAYFLPYDTANRKLVEIVE